MLLLGGSRSGLCLRMLLTMIQTLQIGLRASVLPGGLIMLAILLLMRVEMLSLEHRVDFGLEIDAQCGEWGQGRRLRCNHSAVILK